MTAHFCKGERVDVTDPLGYSGPGVVVSVDRRFHDAVQVRIDGMDKNVWVLGPHVRTAKADAR